jgi:hypothetical protein
LIKTGLLLYGIHFFKSNEGDVGPPPLTTNYLVAINKLASGKGDFDDPFSVGTLFHASSAVFTLEKTVWSDIEELTKTVFKLVSNLNDPKTKNSPIYSKLVQVLWTSNLMLVFYKFLTKLLIIYGNGLKKIKVCNYF